VIVIRTLFCYLIFVLSVLLAPPASSISTKQGSRCLRAKTSCRNFSI
jgi:hypothetical protein